MENKLIVYGGSFCSSCKTLIKTIQNKGIDFEYRDVDDFEDDVATMKIKSLPHVVVNSENGEELFVGRGNAEANKLFTYFGV